MKYREIKKTVVELNDLMKQCKRILELHASLSSSASSAPLAEVETARKFIEDRTDIQKTSEKNA